MKPGEHPFSIGTNEVGKVIIRLGGQLASHAEFNSIEEAEEYIETKPWELILLLITAGVEAIGKNFYEPKKQ